MKKIIGLVIMVSLIYGGYRYINYKNSINYKLKEIGYTEEEITIITDKLNSNNVNILLDKEYNDQIALIVQEKYFIENKLDVYVNYRNENKDYTLKEVVSIVNANANKEFYTDIKETDTSKENLMLVNKFNYLEKDFEFDDLVPISLKYAYSGHRIREEVLENFIDMWHAANKIDLTLIVNSSHRDYDFQEELYTGYTNTHGKAEADSFSARPGHSEHQTGLALDLSAYGSSIDDFGVTEEYIWIKDNAHLYGFILRYPENKTNITGYEFEPWHYRYVGKDVAKKIYDLDITFDEYYELFIK
ncbi:MAG: M15 family metallopeptidase [Bacilli bacterium]|nr:M15 family metallopeptidase [Bacilli bacterium]MDD4718685.1 M15 family metallopeptidase [Bacilli bacterium]